MQILFDEQIFVMQARGGISRYFTRLMLELRKCDEVDVVQNWRWGVNRFAAEAEMLRLLPTKVGRSATVLRQLNKVFHLSAGRPDIRHSTYYDIRYLSSSRPAKTHVVTVHDMVPELFPEYFPNGNPHLAKRQFVDSADVIVCVSESTRADLVEVFGVDRSRTCVVPLGVELPRVPRAMNSVPKTWPLEYLLFVGNRRGYKNFDVLLQAVGEIRRKFKDIHLVCVGGGPFSDSEATRMRQLGIHGTCVQLDASDGQLSQLYSGALLFIFPSLYEGFGLPTLEAMAAGCPVILANTSSHPEVGGSAAEYFDPRDPSDLTQKVLLLLSDGERRTGMTGKGRKRAEMFAWEATASLTLEAYAGALGSD